MVWSLYSVKEGRLAGEFLPPIKFSNNKSQEDIVKEAVEAVKEGHKIIFINGVCGSGKSAIALNLAKELGRASIVVPVKALQKQYEEDYTEKLFLLKKNNQKLKINLIKGRTNFVCPFLSEEGAEISQEREEKNSTIDRFENLYKIIQERNNASRAQDLCDNAFIPCKIEIKAKNKDRLKKFMEKNPKINPDVLNSADKIKRLSIAPVCPYWSPIAQSEMDFGTLEDAKPLSYKGLNNTTYNIYQRKKGCGFYDQYLAYANSDVLIFNSKIYLLETLMNRKPATDVEIIDECDEFLDSLSNEERIHVDRLSFALAGLYAGTDKDRKLIEELQELVSDLLKEKQENENSEEVVPIKDTKVYPILKLFLERSIMDSVSCDEENYCYHTENVARTFEDFFDETYVSSYRTEKGLFVELVTINLKKRFDELLNKNKAFVMMSGTLHDKKVLEEVFGVSNFKIIDAETQMPGKITKSRTGREFDCKYENFRSGRFTRKQYLLALQECIDKAKPPMLVHVISFYDLPSQKESEEYNLHILTREELAEMQDKEDSIKKFKSGKTKVLYTTKCSRGMDFPGETCNSIILTKFPFSNINSIFWKVLKKTKPEYYNPFYMDKSRREFLQKIYRGLRFKGDHIFLFSPDLRVFQNNFIV